MRFQLFTMINIEAFAKRLQKVIDYYGESASSFAEKTGVQRSSISHILSGRNKPSLEFVLKVISTYPDIQLYWLLNGKGEFPSSATIIKDESPGLFDQLKSAQQGTENTNNSQSKKSIERIVVFYSDGTFKNFQN